VSCIPQVMVGYCGDGGIGVSYPGPTGPAGPTGPYIAGPTGPTGPSPTNLVGVVASVPLTVNDYAPTGYVAGSTDRLILTPTSSGSTITGLLAAPDGWQILIYNPSTLYSITFSNLSGSISTNQFACPGGVSAVLGPQYAVMIAYCVSQWIFT
jgi:hypothetical protein